MFPTVFFSSVVGSSTVNDVDRYPIGTKVRKHFPQGWFDGEVISIDVEEKLWKIRYSDGDCEELDKDHLIRHISLYNSV